MKDPPKRSDCVLVKDFVGCKGRFVYIEDTGKGISKKVEDCIRQPITDSNPDSVRDPRLLPLHSFLAGSPLPNLSTLQSRAHFRQKYRLSGGNWLSPTRTIWNFPHANQWHASEQSKSDQEWIAGYPVPHGFHWDVSPAKLEASITVSSTNEVWKIRRGGYLNIYPDEKIRNGSGAQRIWPPKN